MSARDSGRLRLFVFLSMGMALGYFFAPLSGTPSGVFSQPLWAQERSAPFAELYGEYMRLRNTDSELRERSSWSALAERFEGYSKSSVGERRDEALLYASILRMKLAGGEYSSSDFLISIKQLETLAEEFPKSEFRDEALLELSARYTSAGNAERGEALLKEVLERFPETDSAAIAAGRLFGIEKPEPEEVSGFEEEGSPSPKMVLQRTPIVVLDPGHGGEDRGAVGVGGLYEKDVTLSVAFALSKLLRERLQASVRLTRESDLFVPLEVRTQIANDAEADLFLSLHVNASETGKVSGFEVYSLDNTNDSSSAKLAERENASMGTVSDLQFILSDLIQAGKMKDSIRAAEYIYGAVSDPLHQRWGTGKGLGVKKAPFYVLVGAHMPCVLVEMYFINHPGDGALLLKPEFRQDLSEQLYRGIKEFLVSSIGKRTES